MNRRTVLSLMFSAFLPMPTMAEDDLTNESVRDYIFEHGTPKQKAKLLAMIQENGSTLYYDHNRLKQYRELGFYTMFYRGSRQMANASHVKIRSRKEMKDVLDELSLLVDPKTIDMKTPLYFATAGEHHSFIHALIDGISKPLSTAQFKF